MNVEQARFLGRRTSHNNDGFASEDQLIIVRHLQEALPRPDLRSSARPGTYTSAVRRINHLCVALGWFTDFVEHRKAIRCLPAKLKSDF